MVKAQKSLCPGGGTVQSRREGFGTSDFGGTPLVQSSALDKRTQRLGLERPRNVVNFVRWSPGLTWLVHVGP